MEINISPLSYIAGFGPCDLIVLALEFYFGQLTAVLLMILVGVGLIQGYKTAKKGNPRQAYGLFIVFQTVAIVTLAEVVIRIGYNLAWRSCAESRLSVPVITSLMIAITMYATYKILHLKNKRLKQVISYAIPLSVVSVLAAICIYMPTYKSYESRGYPDWRKYPVIYRCTIFPAKMYIERYQAGMSSVPWNSGPFGKGNTCLDVES